MHEGAESFATPSTIAALGVEHLFPESAGSSRQLAQVSFYGRNQLRSPRPGQGLLHVPGILGAAGEELEKEQVLAKNYGQSQPRNRQQPRSLDGAGLPAVFAHHEVDIKLISLREAHDPKQWIERVTATDIHLSSRLTGGCPYRRLEALRVGGEEVEIERRSADAHGRQR